MITLTRGAAVAVLLAGAVACSAPAPVPTAPVAPAATSAPAPTGRAAAGWVMPDLVGRNLQDAQDAIQALTGNAIFVTTSSDATGAGRHQVLDRNWKVCRQNVAPGQPINADAKIDFASVKLEEACR
ncbi:PASTA domain-containing protein [Pseudonocardia sp. GCM10023141]|uniref:PASTA domain-containing protein n=1 Tax=Pseudonocardia sp. GCM10023141 TaxID=3252653 RepID=UPI003612467D